MQKVNRCAAPGKSSSPLPPRFYESSLGASRMIPDQAKNGGAVVEDAAFLVEGDQVRDSNFARLGETFDERGGLGLLRG